MQKTTFRTSFRSRPASFRGKTSATMFKSSQRLECVRRPQLECASPLTMSAAHSRPCQRLGETWHTHCAHGASFLFAVSEPARLNEAQGVSGAGTVASVSGAMYKADALTGKTTLLDVLATRVNVGVISGDVLVDGNQRDDSFQRKSGYVQQQDLHLETSTVREALRFSALLRQPAMTPRAEKIAYCEEVISLLDMETYADAVVGVPGEGLNVEQRKRLTIGVELVAKPELLLFLWVFYLIGYILVHNRA